MDRPYGAIVWKDLLPGWNWRRTGPDANNYARDLAIAMRRNEHLRVLVTSGYFDLTAHSARAEQEVRQAGLPMERVTIKRYASGHMLYLGDTAAAFANDVRELIRSAAR
jgi:carboxypeptidase C (cathepsin A)